MSDPVTVNILLSTPTRGSDVGTWDLPVNGDFNSLDGHFGGVVTVVLTNVNITLTSPAGTPTPSAGPTQAENAVVRLTGTLSGNVQITLPLPGPIIIENLTTGSFVVSFRAVGSGEIIATAQGTRKTVYNDGTNVRFVGGPDPGTQELWASLSAIPAWVTACTVKPYLLCDGSIYSFTDYPYLGAMFGTTFGGNGSTTFGVPDLRGRVPLAYDGTGTRITVAGCGINGQTLGAALDAQTVALTSANNGTHNHGGLTGSTTPNMTYGSGLGATVASIGLTNNTTLGGLFNFLQTSGGFGSGGILSVNAHTHTIPSDGSGTPHNNVQPSQVVGIWVCKT